MRYLSLFSGIEAATVAWHPLGWEPLGFAEIAPFPSAVLAHNYPHVRNYGDIEEAEFEGLQPGLIVFGSPCQSFSVAGKRLGLDDPRGNLALIGLSVVARLRPQWIVFENVPGMLSSGGGGDFGTFLEAVAECGYHCAWRVLDARHFGVPQSRRRVFVVGYLGDWRPPVAALFEPESLRGDIAPSREVQPDVAAYSKSGFGGYREGVGALMKSRGSDNTPLAVMATGQGGAEIRYGLSTALTCNHEAPIVFRTAQTSSNGCGVKAGHAYTLDGAGGQAVVTALTVRRFTPLEHERLQGFPDDYTRIPYRGRTPEKCPDSLRYEALGNSMAVPVMRWIGERIRMSGGRVES